MKKIFERKKELIYFIITLAYIILNFMKANLIISTYKYKINSNEVIIIFNLIYPIILTLISTTILFGAIRIVGKKRILFKSIFKVQYVLDVSYLLIGCILHSYVSNNFAFKLANIIKTTYFFIVMFEYLKKNEIKKGECIIILLPYIIWQII